MILNGINIKNNKQSIFVLLFFALFYLGVTTKSIASQIQIEAQSVDATAQLLRVLGDWIEVDVGVVKKLLTKGADPRKVEHFYRLPSLELSRLLKGYLRKNEICGVPEQHLFGADSRGGLTWINPEWDR